jgi:hypothetical protein
MAERSVGRRILVRGGLVVGAAALIAARPFKRVGADPVAGGPLAFIDCATWGARRPDAALPLMSRLPDRVIVHHTATGNSADLTRRHAYAQARAIQDLHMDRNHWGDTGHHFTISRGGYVLEGRHGSVAALRARRRVVRGVHCVGQNDRSIGIENVGTYLSVQPPDAQWRRLIELCAYVCRQYRIPASEIYAHNNFNATLCPGLIRGRLPELRRAVGRLLT